MPPRILVDAFLVGLLMTLPPVSATATTTAPSSDLAKLCDEYWQGYLKADPTAATGLGDKRYDDRLGDINPAGITAAEKRPIPAPKRDPDFNQSLPTAPGLSN